MRREKYIMKKKNSNLRLCLDPELEKEVQKVEKGAITITIAITALVVSTVGIIVFFLLRT